MVAALVAAAALASPPACRSAQLLAFASLQGATGSMAGGIALSNRAAARCSLEGFPRVRVFDGIGRPLVLTYGRWRIAGRRVVLAPHGEFPGFRARQGRKAYVRLAWSNWCGAREGPLRLELRLPSGGTLRLRLHTGRPRCDAPKGLSSFSVGPFRPWTAP
jgi:hypothetical protein